MDCAILIVESAEYGNTSMQLVAFGLLSTYVLRW